MNNADLIDKATDEIWTIIYGMKREGVNYSVIKDMMMQMTKELEVRAVAEDWLNETS